MKAINKKEEIKKRKARKESIKEGIFANANFALGDAYISPFAIAINASNSLVALLSSVTGLLGPISQIFGSKSIKKYSRKKIVLKCVMMHTLSWLPIILIGILFSLGIVTHILPLALLIFFSLYTIFGNFFHPAWFSWMGDIVDEKYRGFWFSKRNLITGFILVVLALTASFALDYFKKQNMTIIGFIVLFSLAMFCRLISWKLFKKQYEPRLKFKKEDYFSFFEFVRNLPKTNFGRFTIFRGLFAFAISIIAPLVAVYLLRYLDFNYTIYILITFAGTFFSLFFIELWGKFSDKYGNYKTIILTTIIIPIIPLLWLFNNSVLYLILIPSTIGGIVWAGFILASGNLIYDNVSPQKRGFAVSYFNMVVGIGIFLGAGLSALLIKVLTIKIIEPLLAIFIIGSLIRMVVVYVFLIKIREIRKTKKFKGVKSLKDIFLHETKPTLIEEANEIMHIKRYFK